MNVLLLAALFGVELAAAPPTGQNWHSDYGVALAETKEQGKPLLVVLENPDDEPSRIHQVSLARHSDRDELLEKYVLCRLDVRTEHGKKMAAAFKAQRVPHTVVIDKSGRWQIFKKTGRLSDGEWTTTLAKHQRGERIRPVVYLQPQSYSSFSPANCST